MLEPSYHSAARRQQNNCDKSKTVLFFIQEKESCLLTRWGSLQKTSLGERQIRIHHQTKTPRFKYSDSKHSLKTLCITKFRDNASAIRAASQS